METRIAKLEEFAEDTRQRLARIETRLDQTVADLNALRVDMHKGFADMTKWIVGTAIVLGAMAVTIITFVLNNAAPRPAPAPALPPIVIYAQPAVAAPAPAAPPKM